MALLNSRLCWWYLTNTGTTLANGFFRFKPDYIKPFPVPADISDDIEETINMLVDYVQFLHRLEKPLSDLVSNKFIYEYFERIIDGCIYELYFTEYMKDKEIDILGETKKIITPIDSLSVENKAIVIWDIFNQIKKTDNLIRTRLELFATRSPELLKQINN